MSDPSSVPRRDRGLRKTGEENPGDGWIARLISANVARSIWDNQFENLQLYLEGPGAHAWFFLGARMWKTFEPLMTSNSSPEVCVILRPRSRAAC